VSFFTNKKKLLQQKMAESAAILELFKAPGWTRRLALQ
jgi:hypothetical protein